MKKLIFQIDGMMCGHCESHVNDVVRRAENVRKVSSSHVSGLTEAEVEDNVSPDKIVAAIEADGYKVLSVKEEPIQKTSLAKKLFGKGKQ